MMHSEVPNFLYPDPDPSLEEEKDDPPLKRMLQFDPAQCGFAGPESAGMAKETPTIEPSTSLVDVEDSQDPDAAMEAMSEHVEKERHQYKTTAKHRENSTKWHQKWVSKGVPRVVKDGPPSARGDGAPSGASKTLTQVQDEFITEWIRCSGTPKPNERRAAALKAWMESDLRSDLLAGRSGVQK